MGALHRLYLENLNVTFLKGSVMRNFAPLCYYLCSLWCCATCLLYVFCSTVCRYFVPCLHTVVLNTVVLNLTLFSVVLNTVVLNTHTLRRVACWIFLGGMLKV